MFKFFKRCYEQAKLLGYFARSYVSLIYGVWKVTNLPGPRVTVFGASRMTQENPYAQKAKVLGTMLADNGLSVITGGGAGIMEAANCGASISTHRPLGMRSIGIGVEGLQTELVNTCSDEIITVNQFFVRKWLLTRYASAFVVFPGGFGTLDELFEVATLMETGFLERSPIVLFGYDYWQPIMNWGRSAKEQGLILDDHFQLLLLTDEVSEAFEHIRAHMEYKITHQ